MTRQAQISRNTKETKIKLELNLDDPKIIEINTGFAFLDHMFTLIAFWGHFSLKIDAKGDLEIDAHHTIEDLGLVFGQALYEALGERKGIERVANAKVPMDEALSEICLDLSGRSWLEWRGAELLPSIVAGEESDIWREFYKSIAQNAKCNLHINFLYGKNAHHLLESVAKGVGLVIHKASQVNYDYILSTKGSLDL